MDKICLAKLKKPLLILIGGTVGAGKSILSLALAKELEIPEVIGTDAVREILCLSKDNADPFLNTTTHCAWRKIGERNRENILLGYKKHCDAVIPAVTGLANNYLMRGKDCIIEGAHIPHFDRRKISEDGHIVSVLLMNEDRSVHLKRLSKKYAERHGRKKTDFNDCMEEFAVIQEYNKKFCDFDLVLKHTDWRKSVKEIKAFIEERING